MTGRTSWAANPWLANIPIGYSDGYRRSLSHANQPGFANEGKNKTEIRSVTAVIRWWAGFDDQTL